MKIYFDRENLMSKTKVFAHFSRVNGKFESLKVPSIEFMIRSMKLNSPFRIAEKLISPRMLVHGLLASDGSQTHSSTPSLYIKCNVIIVGRILHSPTFKCPRLLPLCVTISENSRKLLAWK